MPITLQISRELSLPAEAVSETFAILAKRGAGRTYTAAVMVEELLKADLHVVAVDPVGVWWGLRAAANGTREGLPIVVLGGEHGDIRLDVGAGELIANLVVEEGVSVVLDLSLWVLKTCRNYETGRLVPMSSRRSPLIVVMQPTHLWDFPDRANLRPLDRPRYRAIRG